ncbi:MAG: glycogen debranching protein [Barnesiella sp.]|nr:glycogen debranching protein [Barnesiella sp.]
MNILKISTTAAMAAAAMTASAGIILETPTYSWHGDTITQGVFTATAPSATRITSDYSAQPGYYMGIDKEWNLKNDISAYPRLSSSSRLMEAVYNMGLDEMVNAVEPDTTLRTGKEWAGVWTRDVSYSILLSMAYMQPEASMISLMKKVDPLGRVIQDTGSGGAWPVSTDREIWCIAAFEVYKVTGDRKWLEYIYPVMLRSLSTDAATVISEKTGLVKGETSFVDWREQSHPRWMQTADVYNTETLSTSVVHSHAWSVLAECAAMLGHNEEADMARGKAADISRAINRWLWMPDKGYYAMYLYGRDNLILNPRAETLGESLAIMWDIASHERAVSITENNPVTPFGATIFYPQIADMPAYHNNSLWPWVGAWWAMANAKAGNEEGVLEAFGSIIRPAALFCTNKENFNLDNGDIATELNSSNMLWCLSGNLALTHKILFGLDYGTDALTFKPFVPEALADTRTLTGFRYRDAIVNIKISGYGSKIKSFKINGRESAPTIAARDARGTLNIEIEMDCRPIPSLKVNRQPNLKAPLTPIAWLEGNTLRWNPIEYIGAYRIIRDGKEVATVHTTSFDASVPGEYQVIGVAEDGTEGFASEPRSTRSAQFVKPTDTSRTLTSAEVAYHPLHPVEGFTGNGFTETDKTTPAVEIPVEIANEGEYFITVRYSNGNGPVNTENRCAIRTLSVDGNRAGIVVMPQRGRANWDDWGISNSLPVLLTPGHHTVTIDYRPENENMNIDSNHALIDGITITRR